MIVSSLGRWLTAATLMASIAVIAPTAYHAAPAYSAVPGVGGLEESSSEAPAANGAATPSAAAVAQTWVATRPAQLRAGPYDGFVQHATLISAGWSYVPYDRTYRGLPVVGGDFVVVIDPAGRVRTASVAQPRPITAVAVPASVTAEAKRRVAAGDATRLVVYAQSGPPRLAWETTDAATVATVYVDVATGAVLERRSGIAYGVGNSGRNGPNPVPIPTTHIHFSIYDRYYLIDPSGNGITCGDLAVNKPFMQTVDTWGNGDARNRVTGCVDAMFAQQTMIRMLSQWLGRSGVDGAGHGYPMWVGLDDINAFWNTADHFAKFGHYSDGRWLTSLDVVGHELGHGVDQFTPGGSSRNGTPEFIADVFGTVTERFANEPSGFDTPDYVVGDGYPSLERKMYDPLTLITPQCFGPAVPTMEVHAAAGPGDHWFYLLAEGSNPTNGQPTSPTCNGATVTGIGIQAATRILYNAMLMKTSNSSYPTYRLGTLQAAANLYGCSSGIVGRVRAAWDAILVPVQPNEPCSQPVLEG